MGQRWRRGELGWCGIRRIEAEKRSQRKGAKEGKLIGQ